MAFPFKLMRVQGQSMAPALRDGSLVVVNERAYARRAPRRGELVAARPRASDGKMVVKRLVGLPHERLDIDGRRWRLGANQFFLLGDQLEASVDSRRFGVVNREELIGRVALRLWPWTILAEEKGVRHFCGV